MGFPPGRRGEGGRARVLSLDLMPELGQYPPRVGAQPPAQGRTQRPGSPVQCQRGVDPDPVHAPPGPGCTDQRLTAPAMNRGIPAAAS